MLHPCHGVRERLPAMFCLAAGHEPLGSHLIRPMIDARSTGTLLLTTSQVLGNVKGVVAVVASILWFRNPVNVASMMGYGITVAGVVAYSQVRVHKTLFEACATCRGYSEDRARDCTRLRSISCTPTMLYAAPSVHTQVARRQRSPTQCLRQRENPYTSTLMQAKNHGKKQALSAKGAASDVEAMPMFTKLTAVKP